MVCGKINWLVMRRCFVDLILYLSGKTVIRLASEDNVYTSCSSNSTPGNLQTFDTTDNWLL